MRASDIVIVSDAWAPQVNGVVRTLEAVRSELIARGRDVTMITPDRFATVPCPLYPEIRLSINAMWKLPRYLAALKPRHIHIATEGPLGVVARRYCLRHGLRFTTSYHTRFPEYLKQYIGLPTRLSYPWIRRFHNAADTMLVATPTLKRELEEKGFRNITLWSRGVDMALFRPHPEHTALLSYPRPIMLYVGRVSSEKNIEAFLSLPLPGTKLVVGDGPQRAAFMAKYPDAVFVGAQHGAALAQYYAGSDVFVFPSKSDTFGLVLLEALACGTPVAAYPVTGPCDVIASPKVGVLDHDLAQAVRGALSLHRQDCVAYTQGFSWQACAAAFEASLLEAQTA